MKRKNIKDDVTSDGYRKQIRMDRRTFVKVAGLGAGALAFGGLSGKFLASANQQVPQIQLLGKNIPKYVDALPNFAQLGRANGQGLLAISFENWVQQVLPASMYPIGIPGTAVWAYKIIDALGVTKGPNYPAYTIEAKRGTTTNVTYSNNLNTTTIPGVANPATLYRLLTVDQTLHWADPLFQHPDGTGPMTPYPSDGTGPVPAVTHLHGAEVISASDGGPDSWFTTGTLPPFIRGSPGSPSPGQAIAGSAWNAGVTNNYSYPNSQEETTLWFHDHALGITRLNVYAGLAGFYFLRDQLDTGIPGTGLNLPAGPQEIEIVIQDRMFDTNGQWFFPDLGINPTIHPFWIPEFFGDTIVVNGKTWPFLDVEPRRYRFRLLNGSNARFYTLSFQTIKGQAGPVFWQIGTDGGLLDRPVMVNQLTIAPGERADVIVDFGGIKQGAQFILRNSAKAPFPAGASPDPTTTGQIMKINVALPLVGTDTSFNPALPGATLRVANPIVRLVNPATGTLGAGVTPAVTRRLTLNEVIGAGGPLEILVNNTKYNGLMSPGIDPVVFPDGVTELPTNGSTELWEIVNLTADTHPIHLHLVQFQLMNRQVFQITKYLKVYNASFPGGVYIPAYGPPLPYSNVIGGAIGGNPDVTPFLVDKPKVPDPNEAGWKDTIRMNPGEVARIVARWTPTDNPIGGTKAFGFDPTIGPGYVWHCHIIDHEDNEMMRPYKVKP